jgi:hypothetical protein
MGIGQVDAIVSHATAFANACEQRIGNQFW